MVQAQHRWGDRQVSLEEISRALGEPTKGRMLVKIQATWAAPMRFDAQAESGTRIVMDSLPEHGGAGGGPTPMQAILIALAGCTGMDVVGVLRKMRAPLEHLRIVVEGERATEHPKVFTRIHIRYEVGGEGLLRDQVERAVTLSAEKYCSVSAMLRKATTITHEIVMVATTLRG